jgi:hypothetical protein
VSITKVVVFSTTNPTKFGFAFFWIFYDFLCILQISAKRIYYWRCVVATRPLERFRTAQLGPSTHGTAGSLEIWRLQRCSRPGNGSGSSACSPGTDWQPRLGRGSTLRRRTTVTGGDGAAARGSGEEGARGGPHATLGTQVMSMESAQRFGG